MSTRAKGIEVVWANSAAVGDVVDPPLAKKDAGFGAEKVAYEYLNYLFETFADMLQSSELFGVMEWLTTTPYPIGGKCTGSDGVVYRAVIANTGNDPVSDSGTNWLPWLQTTQNPFMNSMHFQHTEAAGVTAGTSVANTYLKRTINNVATNGCYNNIPGSSLAANQILLPEGTYRIDVTASAYSVARHRLKLTEGAGLNDLIIGTTSSDDNGASIQTMANLSGQFSIGVGGSYVELWTLPEATNAGSAFGRAMSKGVELENYLSGTITKVA